MRVAMLVLLLGVALPGLALAAAAHVADPRGDVSRTVGGVTEASGLSGADVRFVGVARGAADVRVTVGYASAIPHDLELLAVLQLAPAPEQVAVVHVWRTVSDRGPAATLSYPDASGVVRVVDARAAFAEDAVQLTLPSALADAQAHPCLELRSLRSTHHAEDGAAHVDVVEPPLACAQPLPTATTAEEASPPVEASESAADAAGDARVPAPAGALVALAVALAALSRRR